MLARRPTTFYCYPPLVVCTAVPAAPGPPCQAALRLAAKKRKDAFRQRAKVKTKDRVRFYPTPLPDGVVDKLAAELKIKSSDDRPIDDQAWKTLVGQVIATIVKKAVKK